MAGSSVSPAGSLVSLLARHDVRANIEQADLVRPAVLFRDCGRSEYCTDSWHYAQSVARQVGQQRRQA